jgi:hypothetical protein
MMLLVPIHLDALSLKTDTSVLNAKADFTNLPYTEAARDANGDVVYSDVNGDVAYISEELVSEPFQDQSFYLKAGVHLHWALPDALTKRGTHTSTEASFPEVPNRWLVTRSRQNGAAKIIEKQWVVESDYLYPFGEGEQSGAISYPVTPAPAAGCPFRFLGRSVPFEKWKEEDAPGKYLSSLTAVGYGEPAFAAFYPNCHSVFGFHDEEYAGNIPDGLQYEVIGWYSKSEKDCLTRFLADPANKAKNNDELVELLEKAFKWTFDSGQEFPGRTLCYARLDFKPSADSTSHSSKNSTPEITVANTGTEALSAYLAHKLADSGSPKPHIEDQLEAVSFSSRLNNRQLDVGAKFKEARHEKGFSTISGGTIWSVTPRSVDSVSTSAKPPNIESTSDGEATETDSPEQVSLEEKMAHRLNEVNRRQQKFDRALEDIESMRRQLFSDWYKYLLCAYPPDDSRDGYPNIDEVRNFIEVNGLAPLGEKIQATGAFTLVTDDGGNITGAATASAGSLAFELADALNELIAAVAKLNNSESVKGANVAYFLKQTPGPRYYQPNDPVVLLTGDVVKPSLRHGQDGRLRDDDLLECQLLQASGQNPIPENLAAVTAKFDEIKNKGVENVAFNTWTEQPWNPFLLEWQAEVFPVESLGNLAPHTGVYDPHFIKSNFTLEENTVDFSVPDGKGDVTIAANIYSGSSILTPYAGIQLKSQIEAYLKEQLLSAFYAANLIPQDDRRDDYFINHISNILNWYQTNNRETKDNSALYNIIAAYGELTAASFHSLSQSLGGFNEALLMHKQTLQLDIADPLGFDDYQTFADKVKGAVRQSIISAPQPLNDFNPIRSGAFKLLRLRLVDTFGQVREVVCEKVMTTEQLKVSGNSGEMTLPTRLTQPARINLQWFSATTNDVETNEHPAASPICGWVLPNNLDDSLMIYDDKGKALGSINLEDRWQPAPGSDAPIDVEGIENPHLQKLVKYLLDMKESFLEDFLSALDNAMENIEPENFAQHQDIALLMGSPIALVRASVNLELRGLPAVHQGWNVFRQDLNRNERDTNDFDRVEFPIRLGEYRQFNDGLVGYWKEESDGEYDDDIFYAPQSDKIKDDHIRTHEYDPTREDDPMIIYQTVTSAPQILTILMDPRGSIHATSGILPVKSVSLPPDQYTDALKAIEITFLSAPILTGLGKLRLPLPVEPGFEWSWLQKDKSAWTEITSPGIIRKQVFIDAFAEKAESVWSSLLDNKWIEPTADTDKASIVFRDKRKNTDLGKELTPLAPLIESLLDKTQIGAVNSDAKFSEAQEILEGWLKLRSS